MINDRESYGPYQWYLLSLELWYRRRVTLDKHCSVTVIKKAFLIVSKEISHASCGCDTASVSLQFNSLNFTAANAISFATWANPNHCCSTLPTTNPCNESAPHRTLPCEDKHRRVPLSKQTSTSWELLVAFCPTAKTLLSGNQSEVHIHFTSMQRPDRILEEWPKHVFWRK